MQRQRGRFSLPLPPLAEDSSEEDTSSSSGDSTETNLPYISALESVDSQHTTGSFVLPSPSASIYSQTTATRKSGPPPSFSSSDSLVAPLPVYSVRQPRAERVKSLLPAKYTNETSALAAETRTPSWLLCDFSEHLFDTSREKDDRMHTPGRALPRLGRERRVQDDFEADEVFQPDARRLASLVCMAVISFAFIFGGLFIPIYIAVRHGLVGPPISPAGKETRTAAPIPMRGLIDPDTPPSVYNRTGHGGAEYTLVFSDEFNQDGRTFWPGDDPYWTAQDLYYRSTGNQEYYDPRNARTRDGFLEILVEKVDPAENHNLSYRSAMLQSWNQLCFTGAMIEVAVTLPGNGSSGAFWTSMGNLARAGHPASSDGVWPLTYDSCDVGTLKNQTSVNGPQVDDGFSYLPGQKFSACTCAGEDHPGPQRADGSFVGRSSPEIDIFESSGEGFSQTYQVGPFDKDYEWRKTNSSYQIYSNPFDSEVNSWPGNHYQEAVSSNSKTPETAFTNGSAVPVKYAVDWRPTSRGGHITWSQDDISTFTIFDEALGPDKDMQISQRLISEEPHYIVLNVAIAESFSGYINPDLLDALLPTLMRVDYVRVWQRAGEVSVSCSPKEMPTADYIERHSRAYNDFNLTQWTDMGLAFPKNGSRSFSPSRAC